MPSPACLSTCCQLDQIRGGWGHGPRMLPAQASALVRPMGRDDMELICLLASRGHRVQAAHADAWSGPACDQTALLPLPLVPLQHLGKRQGTAHLWAAEMAGLQPRMGHHCAMGMHGSGRGQARHTTAAAEMMACSPAWAGGGGSRLASGVLRLVRGEGTSTASACQAGGRLARGLRGDLKGDGGDSPSAAGAACCKFTGVCEGFGEQMRSWGDEGWRVELLIRCCLLGDPRLQQPVTACAVPRLGGGCAKLQSTLSGNERALSRTVLLWHAWSLTHWHASPAVNSSQVSNTIQQPCFCRAS